MIVACKTTCRLACRTRTLRNRRRALDRFASQSAFFIIFVPKISTTVLDFGIFQISWSVVQAAAGSFAAKPNSGASGDADAISSFLGARRPQSQQQSRPSSAPSGKQNSAAHNARPKSSSSSSSSSARAETDSERALRRMHAFDEGSDDEDDDEDDDSGDHSDADNGFGREDADESDEEDEVDDDEPRRARSDSQHAHSEKSRSQSNPSSAPHQQQHRPSSSSAAHSFPAKSYRDASQQHQSSTDALSAAVSAASSSAASGEMAAAKTRYGPVRVDRNAPRPQPYMRYAALDERCWHILIDLFFSNSLSVFCVCVLRVCLFGKLACFYPSLSVSLPTYFLCFARPIPRSPRSSFAQ
jgi:hypothetical protein